MPMGVCLTGQMQNMTAVRMASVLESWSFSTSLHGTEEQDSASMIQRSSPDSGTMSFRRRHA